MWDELTILWNDLTILWNDLTIDWNDLTIDWNDLTWNDLTMERNDRIPRFPSKPLFGGMNSLSRMKSLFFKFLSLKR